MTALEKKPTVTGEIRIGTSSITAMPIHLLLVVVLLLIYQTVYQNSSFLRNINASITNIQAFVGPSARETMNSKKRKKAGRTYR